MRLRAEVERLKAEVAQLKEEIRIKDQRLARLPPSERPRYHPKERLAILALRAVRNWSAAQTARVFLLTAPTISGWMRRLADRGPDALIQMPAPLNRFPDFVQLVVRQLRATAPLLGKVRTAQILARAGLAISASSVARFSKKVPPRGAPPFERKKTHAPTPSKPGRVVKARYPHHVWHADLTVVPLGGGFWVPWLPFALPQCWPFAFWIGIVLDHHSRAVLAKRVYFRQPTAKEVCALLSQAQQRAGRSPKYLITDQGAQFQDDYRAWCKARDVRPRYGAVGRSGSIAIIERFIRSLKDECLRRVVLPLRLSLIERELELYLVWYHHHRPHQGLAGKTPTEILTLKRRSARSASKKRPVRRRKGRLRPLVLELSHVEGRAHLPIVTLRRAA